MEDNFDKKGIDSPFDLIGKKDFTLKDEESLFSSDMSDDMRSLFSQIGEEKLSKDKGDFVSYMSMMEKLSKYDKMKEKAHEHEKMMRKEMVDVLKIMRSTIFTAKCQKYYIDLMCEGDSYDWNEENVSSFKTILNIMEQLTNLINKCEKEILREEGA